jgi:hypothetical protein
MLKLPSAIYAERYLLGVVIRDGLDIKDLSPAEFYEPIHQEIAFCVKQINEQGNHPDELVILNALRANNSVVQAHYINELTSEVKESRLNQAWSDEIKRTAALRAIAINAEHVQRLASDPNADPESLIAYTEGTLKSIYKPEKSGLEVFDKDKMLEFDRKNDPSCVLGNRWLCKGGSALWVSQSGVGKSSLCIQAAMRWAIGKDFFGIKPTKPLNVLVLQKENDFGDSAECFTDVYNSLHLDMDERVLINKNLEIYRDTLSFGDSFIHRLRELIVKHSCDIIFVDPLLAFSGIDVNQQKEVTKFCRMDLDKVLSDTGCVLIAMHHTPKPKSAKDKEGFTISDYAYSGSGSAEFTNYFRETAILVRLPGTQPIFKFGTTKRSGRSGLRDVNGDFANEIIIRHSRTPGQVRWEIASQDEINEATESNSDKSKVSGSSTKTGSGHSDSSNAKGSTGKLKA